MRGGPGIPCTRPGHTGAPGVDPPEPLRSPSLSVFPLVRWSSPGLRKSVSCEVKPESWDEIEERRRGAAKGAWWPCQKIYEEYAGWRIFLIESFVNAE